MQGSRRVLFSVIAFLLVVAAFTACADGGESIPDDAGRADAPFIDSGATGDGSNRDGDPGDGGPGDGAIDTGTDTGPKDTTPPGAIGDLAGQAKSHAAVDLTWTAPGDDPDAGASGTDAGTGLTGIVAGYDLRYSTTAITTLAQFLAATAATAAAPRVAGQQQSASVAGLEPATTYHFVLRARDAAGNFGALSNDAIVTTKPRAKLLVSEVALANTDVEGYDFVELVVTQAGWAEGLQIKEFNTTLYTLAPIQLAVDDRIVVHATGVPGPASFAQEDVTKDKTSSTAAFSSIGAYDVYSATNNLTATDSLITVNDGTTIIDAVAISNRDNNAAAATMTAWAAAKTANAWTFAVNPADGVNDCESQKDAVNVAQPAQDLACGGFATGYTKGWSIHRNGTTDTNSKADFFIGLQSPGTISPAPPIPSVLSAIALSATQVDITFDQEIAAATVNAGAFAITGLAVTAANVTNVNRVTLTTSTQGAGGYQVDIASTVKSTYGVSISPPLARFCGFTATPAVVIINEVSPDLTGGTDLVELKVTGGGSLNGYQLRANPVAAGASGTPLATLPAICAVSGDIVVVHLVPGAGTAPTSETIAKDQHAVATYSANYDAAWDVLGGNTGIGFTSQVLTIRNAAGDYTEAAVFSDMSATVSTATFLNALTFVQGLGLWLPANCGGAGIACTDATTPKAKEIAADWRGVSSDIPSNPSIGRTNAAAQRTSWAVGPSSFGLP